MITVLCPTYNEEHYIEDLLKFFCSSEPADKELYIIDGGSSDRTVSIVKKWQSSNGNIKLISNPDRYVPFALNLGIQLSKGDPIIRLDAHTKYAPDYFNKVLETFRETGADIVGGPMNCIGEVNFQRAVGYVTSTKFGVGGSKFHDSKYKGYTDHVYLGAWKRELFDSVGMFDVRMNRNEDDEFHYRARSMGKKIYLNPAIKSFYYPRPNFSKLFSQYFQYGEFKPLVMDKIKSEIKMRHVVPGLFVLYLVSLPFWGFIHVLIVPILLYLLLNTWFSFINSEQKIIKCLSFLIYPTIHIAYGTGTIYGIKHLLFRRFIKIQDKRI